MSAEIEGSYKTYIHGLLRMWMIMGPIYVAVDVLLYNVIVPRVLERCRESSHRY